MNSLTRLFVGNVPEATEEQDLKKEFSLFGTITNIDLKHKSDEDSKNKNFAFVTLRTTNGDIESCIHHFSKSNFKGTSLYVTRARESFLERLQRERQEQLNAKPRTDPPADYPKINPIINLSEKLNPKKRKLENIYDSHDNLSKGQRTKLKNEKQHNASEILPKLLQTVKIKTKGEMEINFKKEDSDKKRMESMKKKRQDFKEKQMIIKSGLLDVDQVKNKKVIFSDDEGSPAKPEHTLNKSSYKNPVKLFDEEDSGDDVNFEIKTQFEGKHGQKVLDLQSRYKSDKRFVLDERFIDDQTEKEKEESEYIENHENVDLGQENEKAKQMNILQDVLGVSIKSHFNNPDSKKAKAKMGMFRFDPSQPEHAKFLAPVEEKPKPTKKSKQKKSKDKTEEPQTVNFTPEIQKVEVSKEQFYKVSETLKEAIAQPTTFSIRSLFSKNEQDPTKDTAPEQTSDSPLEDSKGSKTKNPLDPGERNPFVYDSSDSEAEEIEDKTEKIKTLPDATELKAVWKENLFFSKSDHRFLDGLAFFNKTNENEGQKERRELKSLMKKRIYNKERKNQMFQKKFGGRKKTMKKSYRKKS